MKKQKKLLAILTAIVLAVLTSCQSAGSGSPASQSSQASSSASQSGGAVASEPQSDEHENFNATGMPIVNEKITLTISGARNVLCQSWADTIMVQDIEEMFNIKLDCQEYSEEEWKVQKGLMFASGNIPDLLVSAKLTLNEVSDYGSQGFLLPMNDYIEKYGEATKDVFARNPAMERLSTSADGNIYAFMIGSALPANLANRNWINTKWLERVGKEYPKTLDELYDVCVAFKEQDANGNGDPNDEIPISSRVLEDIILCAIGIPYRLQENVAVGAGFYLKDGAPVNIATDEKFKVFLQEMRRFYADGLLDSAVFIQTFEEQQAKMAQGRIGCYYVPGAPWVYETEENAFDFAYLGGLTSSLNNTPMVGVTNGVVPTAATAISASTKYPEAAFRLLDYFYSSEGSTFGFIGKEGVGWKWDDESTGKWSRVIPDGWTDTEEAFRCGKLVILDFNIYRDREWKLFAPTGNNIWLFDEYEKRAEPYFADVFPTISFTEDEQKRLTVLTADLDSYLKDSVARFTLGETDIESGWDGFQKTLSDMGMQEYVQIYTAAYNRYMGA